MKPSLLALAACLAAAPAYSAVITDSVEEAVKDALSKAQAAKESAQLRSSQAAQSPEADLDEVSGYLVEVGYSALPGELDGLTAERKSAHRLLRRADPLGGHEFLVLVPKRVAHGQQLVYRGLNSGGRRLNLNRVYAAAERFLVLEFDGQIQYLDLDAPDPASGFKLAGYVARDQATSFTDFAAFRHAVLANLGIDPMDASLDQIKKHLDGLKGKAYSVSGSKAEGRLLASVVSDGKDSFFSSELKK